MNQSSNSKILSLLVSILALFVVVKLAWVAVSYLYLPEKGINLEGSHAKSSLYYRYKLASDVALSAIKDSVQRPIRTISAPSMKNIKLVGIYSEQDRSIVTLLKKGKSHILSSGDEIDGFVLKYAAAREAFFEKNGKEYILKLFEDKKKGSSSIRSTAPKEPTTNSNTQDSSKKEISTRDGIKQIPRNLISDYAKDINKIARDIGLREYKKGNKLQGFKVRFIREGTPFTELGLKRGDIIKAINGEDIVDLNGPMSLLRQAGTLEGLSITIVRNNEEKELEYEVK